MSDGEVDYSEYTLLELEEALAGIDKHQYPKNYANLRSAYELASRATLPAALQPALIGASDEINEYQPLYRIGQYFPNHIPANVRALHIVLSLLLLAYGGYGVWINDLYLPGKRSRGVHLHDVSAWIMYGAMICACLVMLSVLLDHYDRRNNERHYRRFAAAGEFLGWSLFGVSLLWSFFQ